MFHHNKPLQGMAPTECPVGNITGKYIIHIIFKSSFLLTAAQALSNLLAKSLQIDGVYRITLTDGQTDRDPALCLLGLLSEPKIQQ